LIGNERLERSGEPVINPVNEEVIGTVHATGHAHCRERRRPNTKFQKA